MKLSYQIDLILKLEYLPKNFVFSLPKDNETLLELCKWLQFYYCGQYKIQEIRFKRDCVDFFLGSALHLSCHLDNLNFKSWLRHLFVATLWMNLTFKEWSFIHGAVASSIFKDGFKRDLRRLK